MGAGRLRSQNQTSGGQNIQPPPLGGRFPSTQQGDNPRFSRPGGGTFGLDFLQGEKELVIAEWKYPG
jgi:hypothetical protein